MSNIKVVKANELNDEIRKQISEIFVDGFYQWIHYFSKDKNKLARAFNHMFQLHNFYVAIIDDKIAGAVACTDGRSKSVILNKKDLRMYLGFPMGSIAYIALRKELENHKYPFDLEVDCGSMEFVMTNKSYRNMGVASAIIKHIFKNTDFKSYVLEVADSNTPAVNLYKKMGFNDYMKVKNNFSKQSGFNYYLYMKYVK